MLPSALSNLSFLVGVRWPGSSWPAGLTPALTIRDWIIAAAATIAVILAYSVVLLIIVFGMWGPDVIG